MENNYKYLGGKLDMMGDLLNYLNNKIVYGKTEITFNELFKEFITPKNNELSKQLLQTDNNSKTPKQ